MFLPTDYQLQINVVYYDVNSARIFFTDGFWKPYADQLIKDYRRETGQFLSDRKSFLAKIKRALFKYYFMKLVQQKKTLDLYSAVISIFHEFSRNSLPIKVTNIDDIPVYYEDEWKLDDPLDVPIDVQSEESRPTSSMSDILLAHESVSRREYDINKEHEDLADEFLNQFYHEKTNLERLKQDYTGGTLQHYFSDTGTARLSRMDMDNVFKLTEKIYDHYHGSIGMVTIFNSISLKDVEMRTEIRSNRRFDLWMKVYQQFGVFRSLVNYIGSDVCEMLYDSFLKHKNFHYYNGYHYVFCSYILHDFIKRSYLLKSPLVKEPFINLAEEHASNSKSQVFNSFRNNKTGQFQNLETSFGVSQKGQKVFSGKGLTNTNSSINPFSNSLSFGSKNSSTSQFSFVQQDDVDSD